MKNPLQQIFGFKSFYNKAYKNQNKILFLCFIIVFIFLGNFSAYAAAAGTSDDGVTAFRGGNFVRASSIIRARAEDSTAQAYLLAMQENIKSPPPSSALISFITSNAASNDDFTVLTGELHLAGLIGGANPKMGEQLLKRLAVVDEYPFAIYALGQLYEGCFGQKPDTKTAEIWYRQAKSRFLAAEQRLEALKAGAKVKADAAEIVAGDGGSSLGRKFDIAKPKGDLEGGSVRTDRTNKDRHRGETGGGAAAAAAASAVPVTVAVPLTTAAFGTSPLAPMPFRLGVPVEETSVDAPAATAATSTVVPVAVAAPPAAAETKGILETPSFGGGYGSQKVDADSNTSQVVLNPLHVAADPARSTLPSTTSFSPKTSKKNCSDCCVIF